jgi:hypothetical protein
VSEADHEVTRTSHKDKCRHGDPRNNLIRVEGNLIREKGRLRVRWKLTGHFVGHVMQFKGRIPLFKCTAVIGR